MSKIKLKIIPKSKIGKPKFIKEIKSIKKNLQTKLMKLLFINILEKKQKIFLKIDLK
jgi:hypothetical protein